jgi:integrase
MKKRGLRSLSIVDAAAHAKANSLPPQSATNIRKKWAALSSLFTYAERKYANVRNPFPAKALIVSDNTAGSEKWTTFTRAELKVLLDSRLPGHFYWLTWLGLHTGARLGELAQLTTEHIKFCNGIWFIHFSPELRLKTGLKKSCVRSVPLHSTLLERGFIDYKNSCAGALFPGIPRHKSGRLSDAPSKTFSRHLIRLGIKRPRQSFSSLRHTFIARLKTLAPQHVETRERLVGHTIAGVAGTYGDDFEAEANDMELLAQRAKVMKMFDGQANGGPPIEGTTIIEEG